MATFYGGENFVNSYTFVNKFQPADFQEFVIYTVPAGHYAILRIATIAYTARSYYSIRLKQAIEVNDSNGLDQDVEETIVSEAEVISFQQDKFRSGGGEFVDLRIYGGDRITFRNSSSLNLWTKYRVHIDVYKMP